MKDLSVVLLRALLIIAYSQAFEDVLIRQSIVYIKCNSARVQTAVYNEELEKIFTLDTERIRRISRSYTSSRDMDRRFNINRCTELLAVNGMYHYVRILMDNAQTDQVLRLGLYHGYQLDFGAPLPFGPEDYDAQARIVGWTMGDEFMITAPVRIERGDRGLIHVRYDDNFLEECTPHLSPYDMKLGDVLVQENKIIGFLKEINVVDNIMGFLPAHSVEHLRDDEVESQGSGYTGSQWMPGTSAGASYSPASSSPSSPCSVADPFIHDISPR